MKALSLKQPWASWVLDGSKSIETRTWVTNHRGPLLICASKSVDWNAAPSTEWNFVDALPRGVALCVVNLETCRDMLLDDEKAARCAWSEGRKAWLLSNVRPVAQCNVKGSLGLFEVPDSIIEYLEAAR